MLPLIQRLQAEKQYITQQRLLILEPDVKMAELLSCHLENRYQITVVGSGQEALAAFATTTHNALLLESDIVDMDLLTFLETMYQRLNGRQLPTIILGQTDDSRNLKLSALELGVDDYITKPFDMDELRYRLQNILPNPHLNIDPITELPGWLTTEYRLHQLLPQPRWACLLIEIHHFSPYLQVYGRFAGNKVLRNTAVLLNTIVGNHGRNTDFVGFLGEETFLLITTSTEVQKLIRQLQHRFHDQLNTWYTPPHIDKKSIVTEDGRFHPLMDISIRSIHSDSGSFTTPLDILTAATQLQA